MLNFIDVKVSKHKLSAGILQPSAIRTLVKRYHYTDSESEFPDDCLDA